MKPILGHVRLAVAGMNGETWHGMFPNWVSAMTIGLTVSHWPDRSIHNSVSCILITPCKVGVKLPVSPADPEGWRVISQKDKV